MKPKNSKERQIAFLKFLLLFLVTVLTIVFAIYFNYKVPNKENALLKDQVKSVEKEMEFQSNFSDEMTAIKSMIDSLDIPGQNISYQNSLIGGKLAELQKKIPSKDSTYRYDMYTNIVNLYVELHETKGELLSLNDAKSTIEEYKEALDRCRADLKQTERDLFIARGN